MGLTQRAGPRETTNSGNYDPFLGEGPQNPTSAANSTPKNSLLQDRIHLFVLVSFVLVLMYTITTSTIPNGSNPWNLSATSNLEDSNNLATKPPTQVVSMTIGDNVALVEATMTLEVSKQGTTKDTNSSSVAVVALSPHTVSVKLKKGNSCSNEQLWMRMTGAALVSIKLHFNPQETSWTGSFSLPIAGIYSMESRLYGCHDDKTTFLSIKDPKPLFAAQGQLTTKWWNVNHASQQKQHKQQPPHSSSIFPDGAWIQTSQVFSQQEQTDLSDYIWVDPRDVVAGSVSNPFLTTFLTATPTTPTTTTTTTATTTTTKTKPAVISKAGVVNTKHGFYNFSRLSNYEIVCFVGSESAETLWKTFLNFRGQLFPKQRPFKFHFHPMKNFLHPDRDWEEQNKGRFRKCKQIFISLDEPDDRTLSRTDYSRQVSTFLNHVIQAIPDKTFPIWMLTMMMPSAALIDSTLCAGSSSTLAAPHSFHVGSEEHPCNFVLKELFRDSPFPSRVQLLDNTDLSLPHLDQDDNYYNDIVAMVAARLMVVVGKQVQDWRSNQQIGQVNGLKRGDSLIANPEEVPYTGWNGL